MTYIKQKLSFFFAQSHTKFIIIGAYMGLFILLLLVPKIPVSSVTKTDALTIIIFPESVSIELIRAFTAETGIKVNVKNIETDAEFNTYLQHLDAPYDLACIPEYMTEELEADKLLLPLDLSQIPNYSLLYPLFMETKETITSVPFAWTLFGIGTNSEEISLPQKISWAILFDPKYRVCIPDDLRHLLSFAALALRRPIHSLSNLDITTMMHALHNQKSHVELYSDTNIALVFANNVVPLAFSSYKTIELINRSRKNVKFIVPTEGGIRTSLNWVILKRSKNTNLAHAFIDFVSSQKSAAINQAKTEFLPTNNVLLSEYWDPETQKNSGCPFPSQDVIKKAKAPCKNISAQKISTLWITLKSS